MKDKERPVIKHDHILARAVFSIGVTIAVGVIGFLAIRWLGHLPR